MGRDTGGRPRRRLDGFRKFEWLEPRCVLNGAMPAMLQNGPPRIDVAHSGFQDRPVAAFITGPQMVGGGRAADSQQPMLNADDHGSTGGFSISRIDGPSGRWFDPPPPSFASASSLFAGPDDFAGPNFAGPNYIGTMPNGSPDFQLPMDSGIGSAVVSGQAVIGGDLVLPPPAPAVGELVVVFVNEPPPLIISGDGLVSIAESTHPLAADTTLTISANVPENARPATAPAQPIISLAFDSPLAANQPNSSAGAQAQQSIATAAVGVAARAPTAPVGAIPAVITSVPRANSFYPVSTPTDGGATVPPVAQDALPQHAESTAASKLAIVPASGKAANWASGGQVLSVGEAGSDADRKIAMAGLPVNLSAVDHAIKTVMAEIGQLSGDFTRWWDDREFKPAAIAVGAAAIGAAATYYLRRRGSRKLDEIEEEASTSWLFARLQPVPSE